MCLNSSNIADQHFAWYMWDTLKTAYLYQFKITSLLPTILVVFDLGPYIPGVFFCMEATLEATGTSAVEPKIRRELSELALLFDISQRLDQSMDFCDVAGPVLQAIADNTGMVAMLTLVNRETSEIYIETAHGPAPASRSAAHTVPEKG